jgi:hypothetical protein
MNNLVMLQHLVDFVYLTGLHLQTFLGYSCGDVAATECKATCGKIQQTE